MLNVYRVSNILINIVLINMTYTFSSPQDGVYIYGLSLDGAGWDKRGMRLVEPQPKVLFTPLPVVHMFAVNELTKEQKAQKVRKLRGDYIFYAWY